MSKREAQRFEIVSGRVAGLSYHVGHEEVVALLPTNTPLQLVREPTNAHDGNAVRLDVSGRKIGYVPATMSRMIAALIDNGYDVRGHILSNSGAAVEMSAFVVLTLPKLSQV